MADEKTQVQEDTLWWAFDGSDDDSPSAWSFDEPLEWPEALTWGDPPEGWTAWPSEGVDPAADPVATDDAPLFPPVDDPSEIVDSVWAQHWVADPVDEAAAAREDGGDDTELHHQPLPESIRSSSGPETPVAAAAAGIAPVYVSEGSRSAKGKSRGPWWQRIDLRHGNAAIVALVSFVSIVLLGMFMSVRARNNVPTDPSQTQTTTDQIATDRPLNTIPFPTTPTTLVSPPSTISLTDLLPPAEDGATANAGATGGTGGVPSAGATGTTAAPARSAAPTGSSGGGGSGSGGAAGGTTQPTTATTEAPVEPDPPATTPTTQPVDTTPTTPSSRPNITIPDISIPSFPTTPTTQSTLPRRSITGWPGTDS